MTSRKRAFSFDSVSDCGTILSPEGSQSPIIEDQLDAVSHQDRLCTISGFVQCINSTVPNQYYDLVNLTLLSFPYFLVFELWVFHTYHVNRARYNSIVESTHKKLRQILETGLNQAASYPSAFEFVQERVEPLFYFNCQELPHSHHYGFKTSKKQKRAPETKEDRSFTCFESLPDELQVHILNFVDSSQWKECVTVSQDFKSIFLESRKSVRFNNSTSRLQRNKVLKECRNLRSIIYEAPSASLDPEMSVSSDEITLLPRKVEELRLPRVSELNEQALSHLCSLNLTSLEVEGLEIDEKALNCILSKPKVQWKRLGFKNANIKPRTFVDLLSRCELDQVESLDLSGLDLGQEDLKNLLNLSWKKLSDLTLCGNFLSPEIVRQLGCKFGKQLRVLKATACLIDHNDVKMICDTMPELEILELGYSRVNPSLSTLEHLAKLKKLKKLQLRGWPIVTGHLKYILSNLTLEELDVKNCAGLHSKNYEPTLIFALSETKVLLSDLENENFLEAQMKDLLEYAKRFPTHHLCRLFFPPLCRTIHREHFLGAFRRSLRLITVGGKSYGVPQNPGLPSC